MSSRLARCVSLNRVASPCSRCPPSRCTGLRSILHCPCVSMGSAQPSGMRIIMPLSKLPSPNCSDETFVFVKKAPISTPVEKRRVIWNVRPRSPAKILASTDHKVEIVPRRSVIERHMPRKHMVVLQIKQAVEAALPDFIGIAPESPALFLRAAKAPHRHRPRTCFPDNQPLRSRRSWVRAGSDIARPARRYLSCLARNI